MQFFYVTADIKRKAEAVKNNLEVEAADPDQEQQKTEVNDCEKPK